MAPIVVGQRIDTPLGAATVLGFEQFNARGFSDPLCFTDNGGRMACRLDTPENWLFSESGAVPYFVRSQCYALQE